MKSAFSGGFHLFPRHAPTKEDMASSRTRHQVKGWCKSLKSLQALTLFRVHEIATCFLIGSCLGKRCQPSLLHTARSTCRSSKIFFSVVSACTMSIVVLQDLRFGRQQTGRFLKRLVETPLLSVHVLYTVDLCPRRESTVATAVITVVCKVWRGFDCASRRPARKSRYIFPS